MPFTLVLEYVLFVLFGLFGLERSGRVDVYWRVRVWI